MDEHVVVVGMACRYPDAHTPAQLWETVLHRRRAFRPLPPGRLPLEDYGAAAHAASQPDADRTYLTRAAVLAGWTFDRQRFRVPADVFRAVDLAHWLALEVAEDALTDAGVPGGDSLDRSRVGVIIGNSLTGEFSRAATMRVRWPYVRRVLTDALAGSGELPGEAQRALVDEVERRYKAPFPAPSDETLAGALANTIAGRICNYFDFHGTGYTVDAACASSLIAVNTAADALTNGTLDLALAGGVDLSLDPFELVGFARLGALATDEMRVFDAAPTGFLPGEGCGMLVLCRESYAHERGLQPYARLLGWGTSADGNGGLTRPELGGQRQALLRAYALARLDPAAVGLVEGHGTGTAIGDETELQALLSIRGAALNPAVLGSIKANIGHTKAAAGAAGTIKAVLALYHRVLPPTTGCVRPHPLLTSGGATLRVPAQPQPWLGRQRYASVSAMGFGGINAHVVLGEAPTAVVAASSPPVRVPAARQVDHEVVVCTGADAAGLAVALDQLQTVAPTLSQAELTDLAAHQAHTHRASAPARFAAAVATPDALAAAAGYAAAALRRGRRLLLDERRSVFASVGEPLRVGYLFSGQAAPVYPDRGAIQALLPSESVGYGEELPVPDGEVVDTRVAQPGIVRSSLAGLAWLDELGVAATAGLGHSLGELTALCWAGALTAVDTYALARARGAAMAACDRVDGAMLSVAADLDTVTTLVHDSQVVVAADNGPRHVVVSGPRHELTQVATRALRLGVSTTPLPVSHAFHSPLMSPAADELRPHLASLQWRPLARRVVSTVSGDWLEPGGDPAGLTDLLLTQLAAPVRFQAALAKLRAETDLLVEVGPGRVLAGLAQAVAATDAGSPSAAGVSAVTAAMFAAGAAHSVEPYVAHRFARPFDPDRAPQFLTSPCEDARDRRDPHDPREVGEVVGSGPPKISEVPDTVMITDDVVGLATARFADAVELDPSSIGPDTRPLADLHLSSLRVSQLVAEVAAELGKALPAAPLALAKASIAEVAAAITDLPDRAEGARETAPAGVASWVRAFADEWVPTPQDFGAQVPPTASAQWALVGPLLDHPAAGAIRTYFSNRAGFPSQPGPARRLLVLPPGPTNLPVEQVVTALRDSAADQVPLLVLHHGGVGGAVGRSLAIEHPAVPVLVVEVPADERGVAQAAAEAQAAASWTGFTEVRYDLDGRRTTRALAPLPWTPRRDHEIPLADGEVCLVAGGAKGIGVECAAALAQATGAAIVLLGRSPAGDPRVQAGLDEIMASGGKARYLSVDLADPEATASAIQKTTAELGPVRGLLHAAARNVPGPIEAITPETLQATLTPKVHGFENLLAALDLDALRFAVTFGSVIGRTGLAGEAEYAIANEWLARRCRELAADRPGIRWLNVAWSAWSGVGMGVRLGVLDRLLRLGLEPIPVPAGTDALLRLLGSPDLPADVVVTGRLPDTPTLQWRQGTRSTSRFLESWRASTPGVELVADATLSTGSDPYLADHQIDGVDVLPAVLGLEAMAQAARVLQPHDGPAVFRDVALRRAVTIPARGTRTVRVAALAREDGSVAAVTRSDETGFATDHFAAVYGGEADPPPPPGTACPVAGRSGLRDAAPLYGPMFFHGPRFHRVRGYRLLAAYRCVAEVSADPEAHWFGTFHDQKLVLGDPGARDAFLHVLQGCVPDRRVLPVGVEQVTVYRPPRGTVTVEAVQRAQDTDSYLFDLVIRDADQAVCEQWRGLTLRAVGPLEPSGGEPGRWPLVLLGPHLARKLANRFPGIDLAVVPAARDERKVSLEVAAQLRPGTGPARHAADGRIVMRGGRDGAAACASHLAHEVIVAVSPRPVAVDWEPVGTPHPLEGAAARFARELVAQTGEPVEVAGTRLWTCREAMHKLGLPPRAPIVLETVDPDGMCWLVSGRARLASTVFGSTAGTLAICVGEVAP